MHTLGLVTGGGGGARDLGTRYLASSLPGAQPEPSFHQHRWSVHSTGSLAEPDFPGQVVCTGMFTAGAVSLKLGVAEKV